MIRSVTAVIIGYLAMVVPIVAMFSIYTRLYGSKPGFGFSLISLGVGFTAAIIGGLTAGLIAQHSPMLHAAALAGLSTVFWLFSGGEDEPQWLRIANLMLMIAGVLVGGSLLR